VPATRTRICRYATGAGSAVGLIDASETPRPVAAGTVAEALAAALAGGLETTAPAAAGRLLAPIDAQEVWGAGVTYVRSRDARIAEAGGSARDHYAEVYDADRAELFFKATPHRVAGPGATIALRADSRATVPEPELALWLDADLRLLGAGLANDLTARDIEAENPLYVPQAKIWDGSCALGPWVVACGELAALGEVELTLAIRRDGRTVFSGRVGLDALRRDPAELIALLGRDSTFPHGAILLTGTGIVPPEDVNLQPGDDVHITGTGLGELHNRVAG